MYKTLIKSYLKRKILEKFIYIIAINLCLTLFKKNNLASFHGLILDSIAIMTADYLIVEYPTCTWYSEKYYYIYNT